MNALPTGPILRNATPADAAGILAIYAPHVVDGTASYEEVPPDTAEMARRMAEVAARGLPWLVVELPEAPGRVAGYAYAGPFRSRSAYRHTVENSVYVADWAQGHGLGRLLLGTLIDRCAALGHRRMIAVIGEKANAASVALHARMGFVEAGVLPGCGFKHGRWLDLYLMQRPLGDGADTIPDR